NVELKYNSLVNNIAVYDSLFAVETSQKERYLSDHIIIATGGKSYPKTGSDGTGYMLAEKLGHTIIEPRPALTDVRIKNHKLAHLSGLSFDQVEVTVWHENKKVIAYQDDLLFTHKGLSGPAILNASRWMSKKDQLTINFLYPKSYEETKIYFQQQLPSSGKEEIITFLKKQKLPKSFCQLVCEVLMIDEHLLCAKLSKKTREELVQMLTKCLFEIDEMGGFHIAMATAGGIHLKEVNPTTMESRKQKGLYLIGEVLDVDGNTGGYNLQAAFSTAYLCAKSLNSKN
ncbi:MAG: hypothetical protein K0S30_1272, partial [Clostridia bacterium]|nr:hypothetical protein [Clostridia bacterium]